jgi:ACS family hexuronate transporter-like MFS transporter
VFGQHEVGTATGLSGMMGWLGGMIFSLIVGALATTIGYNPLFVCLVLFDIVGATVAWFLLKSSDYSGTLRAPKVTAPAAPATSTGR